MEDGMMRHGTATMTVAEAYLAALKANGIDHVFANAGTDFAPIIEGLLRANDAGRDIPRFVTVPHENVAMAMAQGYFKISGRMAGVMVHVTVGTANALCGLMNAARDNVPLLLAAGRTPLTEGGDAGSRNVGIHWGQEAFDQGSSVREYVKWDYELRAGQPVDAIIGRALDIAMTEPMGPVYMTLPREVLGGELPDGPTVVRRQPGAMPPVPSQAAIERAADALAAAENPLILSGGIHHSPAFFEALSAIADAFAIAVCDVSGGSLPTSHRMNMGGASRDVLRESDVILLLDAAVPWIPRFAEPRPDTTIIQIASDPTFRQLPFRGFQTDIAIAGDPALALPLLQEALAGKLKSRQATIDTRRRRNEEKRARIDEERARILQEAKSLAPIHPAWTAHCLNQIKKDDAVIINELGLPPEYLDLDRHGCYLPGANAGGLGRGLGEALGVKLAAPNRQVIAVVGDGSYMFCVPTAAHFVGRAESLPTLTIVSNNAEWYAVRRAALSMYPKGRASTANTLPLVELSPTPAFEKTVEACDGYGERVDDPAKLPAALERAFTAIEDGRQALLNVMTRAGGRG